MALKYALIENLLTDAADDYTAQIQDAVSRDLDYIVKDVLKRGTTLGEEDVEGAVKLVLKSIANITAAGELINTDLFKTRFSVSGTFDGPTDSFRSNAHTLKINLTAGSILKEALAEVRLEKVTAASLLPHVLRVKDIKSGSVNENITSGGVVEIVGSRLKIEGADSSNGVYFAAEDDGTTHKVVSMANNQPARLIVIVPTLTAGDYTLQVKTQYSGGGKQLSSPRTGIFDKPLTVAGG